MAGSKDKGQAYSIRFTPKELEAMRILEAREGVRVSDVVHAALAQYFASRRVSIVDFDVPEGSRVYFYTGAPAPSETANDAPREKELIESAIRTGSR